MGTIVAIGGGEIDTKETLAIDKEIIRLSGKKNPRLLFIPTASSDSESYWQEIQSYYGDYLKCQTDVLNLIETTPSKQELEKIILSADIVFVGGGNTLKMMRRWRHLGVDRILKRAWEKGIVLCGVSAGSICWFDSGHSDSLSYYSPKKWQFIRVMGLGFIRGVHCPHYDSKTLGVPRKKSFQEMMTRKGGMGIAIDDRCAIIFKDDTYRVISATENAGAYSAFKKRGTLMIRSLTKDSKFRSISELYDA